VSRDELPDSLEPHSAGAAELLRCVSRFSAVWAMHCLYFVLSALFFVWHKEPNTKYKDLLPSKTRDHSFVNLARQANVVEIVFADHAEFSRLIQLEHFASLNFFGFT